LLVVQQLRGDEMLSELFEHALILGLNVAGQAESAWTDRDIFVTCGAQTRLNGTNLAELNLWRQKKTVVG